MRTSLKFGIALTACLSLAMVGCHQSSHASVSTYEYSDQGRAEQPVERIEPEDRQPSSDYQMVAPGQMAAPGEMVPPGRPVVEPRRNP